MRDIEDKESPTEALWCSENKLRSCDCGQNPIKNLLDILKAKNMQNPTDELKQVPYKVVRIRLRIRLFGHENWVWTRE